MNILIDVRPLLEKHYTGISIYLLEFLNALFERDKKNNYFLFFNSYKAIPFQLEKQLDLWQEKYTNVQILSLHYPNKFFNLLLLLKIFYLDKLLEKKFKLHFDIVFTANINFFNFSKDIYHILVVHDLAFLHFSKYLSFKERLWHKLLNVQNIYKKSNYILTVSENTKLDLVELGIDKEKIKNIPLAVNCEKIKQLIKQLIKQGNYNLQDEKLLKQKYFVFVSSLDWRKNILNVLLAFQKFRQKNPNYYLYLIGKQSRYFIKILKSHKNLLNNVVLFDYLEDNRKFLYLKHSVALLYPSFYEGFGIPVLEASCLFVPAIVSRNSSLLEYFADFTLTVNPDNIYTIQTAMQVMIDERRKYLENLKNEFAENRFTWDNYVNEFLKIIKKI